MRRISARSYADNDGQRVASVYDISGKRIGVAQSVAELPPTYLAPDCDSDDHPVGPEVAAMSYEHLGRMLADLFEHEGTMILSRGDDEFTLNFISRSRSQKRQAFRSTLTEVFEAALGREPSKVCAGPCGRMLSVNQFGPKHTSADGRCNWCRQCESGRIGAIKRKRKLKSC